MEFNLITDIEKSVPNVIAFNYKELKEELKEKIKPYKELAVTEEDLKEAKSDKATLNKLKKALNDRRIEVKRAYNTPLEVFENQVKELVSIVDEGVTNIDGQVKAFEAKQTEEKLKAIATFYAEEFEKYIEILPLERIIPEKWQNKGCKLSDIKQEIRDKIIKFQNDIDVIKAMKLECEDRMLDAYVRTLDMGAALREKHEFEDRQKALKKTEKIQPQSELVETVSLEIPDVNEVVSEQLKTIDVRFYDTSAEFRKEMKRLTDKYSIRYSNVPKGENNNDE